MFCFFELFVFDDVLIASLKVIQQEIRLGGIYVLPPKIAW